MFRYVLFLQMKPTFDDLFKEFTRKLSLNDAGKKLILGSPLNQVNRTACYDETIEAFHKICAAEFVHTPKAGFMNASSC